MQKKAAQSMRLLFSAALFAGSLNPVIVHAEENTSYGDIDGDPIISITDLNVSRVEEAEPETGSTSLTPAGEIEFINVIIELEEPCVLDKGLVPGTPEAEAWSDHLVNVQNQITASAEKEMNVSEVNRTAPEGNRQAEHFTNVMNGMTMRIPAGMISMIKSISGVKRVFEEATYSAPKTEQNEIEPMVNAVSDLIGTGSAYTGSYHSEGMVIGVLDTSLDVAHSAFSSEPENPRISEEDVFEGIRAENAYVSSKIPFAYDYFDYDSDVVPEQNNENAIHGTHVSSIAAGKDHMITGIAPEAQIAFFKVFPDYEGSSSDSILIRALEDSV